MTSSYGDGGSDRPPHPDIDELADLAAGANDDAAVRGHVDTCPECQQRLTDIAAAGASVAAELAALPIPPIPADLVRRIDEAVAAERPTTTPGPTSVPPLQPVDSGANTASDLSPARTESTDSHPYAAPSTVVPLADKQSFWRRHGGAVASSAAAAVIIAFVAVLFVGHFGDKNKPTGTGTASAAKHALPLVTVSGARYSTVNLGAALPTLLAHQPPGAAAESDTAGTAAGAGTVAGTPGTAPAPSVPKSARALAQSKAFSDNVPASSLPANLTALKTDPLALQQCLLNLRGQQQPGDGSSSPQPLAIDLGLWGGQPAAVFVFPVENRPDRVEVFVAPAGCPSGVVLFFQRFSRP